MSNKTKRIECLRRLDETTSSLHEIMAFLLEEKFITKDDLSLVKSAPLAAKEVEIILSRLQSAGTLLLLEYEWIILPAERITITIVTENAKREFLYSSF